MDLLKGPLVHGATPWPKGLKGPLCVQLLGEPSSAWNPTLLRALLEIWAISDA